MIRLTFIQVLSVIFSICISAQPNSWNTTFDEFIKQGMTDWKVPGLAAIVIVDGEVVFKETYGICDITTNEKVDENTLFSMASTTKAITAIALGLLVDQGKISWEDKVIKYIPELSFSNPLITQEARIKDLLTHNLGLSNPPILWMYELSINELIEKCSLIKQVYPVRGGFIYQNTMYVLAAEIITRVSGNYWRDFYNQNILEPLGMTRTITSDSELLELGNFASPHYNDYEDGIIKTDCYLATLFGPAGGMWSSINDLENYLCFLLDEGIFKGDTLLKHQTFNELFTPQTIDNDISKFTPTLQLINSDWVSYGFGWFQHTYKGCKVDFHTGSREGFVAITGLIHEKDIAVYVFANMHQAELRHAIMYKAFDLYAFDDNRRDWNEEVFDLYSERDKMRIANIENRNKSRIKNTKSIPAQKYSGTYYHDIGGNVNVGFKNDTLIIDINNTYYLTATHWHYNSFITNKFNPFYDRELINFSIDEDGNVNSMQLLNMNYLKEN